MTLETLLNGMKSLFAGLGAKTSDSNYGVALLDKTSGEPKGLMGMSDLASVLGVGYSDAFGQTDGDYKDMRIGYGLLVVRNYNSGNTSVYSVGNAEPHLIYPNSQESQFSVAKQDATHVRITKVGSTTSAALRAKVIFLD